MPIGWSQLIIFYSWFKIAHWDRSSIDSDVISFMSLDILDVSFSPLFLTKDKGDIKPRCIKGCVNSETTWLKGQKEGAFKLYGGK